MNGSCPRRIGYCSTRKGWRQSALASRRSWREAPNGTAPWAHGNPSIHRRFRGHDPDGAAAVQALPLRRPRCDALGRIKAIDDVGRLLAAARRAACAGRPGPPASAGLGKGVTALRDRSIVNCQEAERRRLASLRRSKSSLATVFVELSRRCCEDIYSRPRGCEDEPRSSGADRRDPVLDGSAPVEGSIVPMQTTCRSYTRKISERRQAGETVLAVGWWLGRARYYVRPVPAVSNSGRYCGVPESLTTGCQPSNSRPSKEMTPGSASVAC